MLHIGIDPGWASTGIAKYDSEAKSWVFGNFVPRDEGITSFIFSQFNGITKEQASQVVIERFVAYKGIHSDASENILMLIGAILFRFEKDEVPVNMFRAVEWKPALCKWLVKNKGFQNPSSSFDKKFSIAAAKCIVGDEEGIGKITDHEADAICLAFLGYLNSARTK